VKGKSVVGGGWGSEGTDGGRKKKKQKKRVVTLAGFSKGVGGTYADWNRDF